MILLAGLLSAYVGISPLDGPALPLMMCRGLTARVVVQTGMWTNGVYGVQFAYRSPLSIQQLAALYRQEVPGSPKGSFNHNSYHFYRHRDSVYQDCWITKNYGPLDPEITSIIITETPDPTEPPPRRWYRQAISLNPPVPLIRIPFEPSVTAQTVFPLFRATTASKSRSSPQWGWIFNAHLSEPLASVVRKAKGWFAAHGYRTIGPNEWFKPNVPLFEIEIAEEVTAGMPKGTRVTLYLSSTNNSRPMP